LLYAFAGNELNSDTQELWRGGAIQHIEPQVLAVLEYLIAHQDRVVSKIELFDEVWGSRFVSESALTSRIKSARRVCGDSGREQRVIRTIHGRGYRFVAELERQVTSARGGRGALGRGGIVGRDRELGSIEESARSAAEGQRQAIFITGTPGIGKSAVLAEALELLDDTGHWRFVRGQCLESRSGTEPYFGLLDALARSGRADDGKTRAILDRVAPTWLAQLPALIGPDDAERLSHRLLGTTPHRMLRDGAEAFEELSHHGPTLLALEDLQWADECTLDVLELLMQRDEPAPLLILLTLREGPSPARNLLNRLATTGRARELPLEGLTGSDAAALISDVLDVRDVPPEIAEVAARRSDGVPLALAEIVGAWRRAGHLLVDDGRLELAVAAGELDSAVPETLRQLVEIDLARAEGEHVAALEAAALAGTEFDAASVQEALGRPLLEVEEVLTRAGDALGYLSPVGGTTWPDGTTSTRFAFRHDLYRQILEDRLSHHRRARVHAAIGAALASGYAGRVAEIAPDLARHFVEAGDHERSVEYLCLAGEQAAARNAFTHAERLLLDALSHTAQLEPGSVRDRAELRVRMALGPAIVATRGWYGAEVAENYERAMILCSAQAPCDEASLARYSLATITELRGEYSRTEELLDPMVDDAANNLLTETRELLACSTFHQGKFRTSLDHSTAVLDRWEDIEASELMSRLAEHPASACNSWASFAAWYLGESDRSLELAERAVTTGAEHLYALSTAQVQRSKLHQMRREPTEAAHWARAAIELADEQGFPMRANQARIILGWADAVSSDADGTTRAEDGLAQFRASGAQLTVPYYLGLVAEARLTAGDADAALEALAEAIDLAASGARTFFFASELHRLRATAGEATGEWKPADVLTELRLAVGLARELGSPPLELRALTQLAAEGRCSEPDEARLRALLARFDGQRPTADTRDALALLN
jgi:DNA-binding winged helix-turn-helix (wHTH) protein/tetratricopeptide (TPR) repeat protein